MSDVSNFESPMVLDTELFSEGRTYSTASGEDMSETSSEEDPQVCIRCQKSILLEVKTLRTSRITQQTIVNVNVV